MSHDIETPVYSRISYDIAVRIARGDLKENTRILGRSILAGEYNVSPETIRKSIRLLADMDIVKIMPNSGVIITSRSNALKYIERYDTGMDFRDLKKELKRLFIERDNINNSIMAIIDRIFELSDRFRNFSPLYTLDFEVPEGSSICGKSISDIKLWQSTGATLVAIKRDGKTILSPGPYFDIRPLDILIVTGSPEIPERVLKLIGAAE